MKRIAPVVVVVVIFATGASSHKSGWMESFDAFGEGYSYGKDVLPAPWEGAVSMIAGAKLGRDDTAGAQGPGRGWSWGHAFRPATDTARVGDSLVAKIFLPGSINYEAVKLALTTEKTPGSSGDFNGGQ